MSGKDLNSKQPNVSAKLVNNVAIRGVGGVRTPSNDQKGRSCVVHKYKISLIIHCVASHDLSSVSAAAGTCSQPFRMILGWALGTL